jgi:hypothetical protein
MEAQWAHWRICAFAHFIEPMACLAVASLPAGLGWELEVSSTAIGQLRSMWQVN